MILGNEENPNSRRQQASTDSYFDDDDGRYDAELDALLAEMRAQRPISPARAEPIAGREPRRLRPAPRRGVGSLSGRPVGAPRSAGHLDATADIELRCPPGYRRDGAGRWRYTVTGGVVTGAHDVTLRNLYAFTRADGVIEVPLEEAQIDDNLAWCLDFRGDLRISSAGSRARTVIAVPADAWDERARLPLTVYAPELTPDQLLDTDGVAALAAVDRSTVAAYLARGQLPEPVARLGNSPVWSRPVIRQWLDSRPGPGVGGGPRRPRSDRSKTRRR